MAWNGPEQWHAMIDDEAVRHSVSPHSRRPMLLNRLLIDPIVWLAVTLSRPFRGRGR